MKIHISFEFRKKSDLYLMKIQISFVLLKKIIFVFNENTNQFWIRKKKKKKKKDLKIQINFLELEKSNLKIRSTFGLEISDLKDQISFWFRKIRSKRLDQFLV